MLDAEQLTAFFTAAPLGRYLAAQEQSFFRAAGCLKSAAATPDQPENSLYLGLCGLWSGNAGNTQYSGRLPENGMFGQIAAAHFLETQPSFAEGLEALGTLLAPEGSLILSVFNPHCLWRCNLRRVPDVRQSLALPEFKSLLAAQNWRISSGSFIHYLPPLADEKAIARWRFLEAAGNRWWPHAAAVYALVLRRTQTGCDVSGCLK